MANTQKEFKKNNSKAFLLILVPIFLFLTFFLLDLSWDDIRFYPLLGIPLGVIIWSFLGCLCKLVYTIYQEPEINYFFKLIVVRSLMGIIFGTILFLFLDSFVDAKESNMTYLVVFIAGVYSDAAIFVFLEGVRKQALRGEEPSVKEESSILDDSSFTDDNSDAKE